MLSEGFLSVKPLFLLSQLATAVSDPFTWEGRNNRPPGAFHPFSPVRAMPWMKYF